MSSFHHYRCCWLLVILFRIIFVCLYICSRLSLSPMLYECCMDDNISVFRSSGHNLFMKFIDVYDVICFICWRLSIFCDRPHIAFSCRSNIFACGFNVQSHQRVSETYEYTFACLSWHIAGPNVVQVYSECYLVRQIVLCIATDEKQ